MNRNMFKEPLLDFGQGFETNANLDECAKFQQFARLYLADLPKIMQTAISELNFELTTRKPTSIRRNTHSNGVNEKLAGLLSEHYENNFREVKDGRFGLYFPDYYFFFVKKLNARLMPCNISTKSDKRYKNQLSLPIGNLPLVYLGYRVNNDNEYIGTYASFIDGSIRWSFDFAEIEQEKKGLFLPVSSTLDENASLVKPKTKVVSL